jgi:hypothetical protein
MRTKIEVNHVFESVENHPPFELPARVLWIDEANDFVSLISIENPPKRPWSISLEVIETLLNDAKIRRTMFKAAPFMLVLEEEIDDKDKKIRDANWDRIRPLIETKYQGEIFYPSSMGALISEQSKTTGLPRKTYYRLLYRYWLLGSIKNALLPNYMRSGGAGKPKTFVNGEINGKPPKYLGLPLETKAKILSDEDKAAIKIGYALYKDNQVQCITDAYTRTLNKFYRSDNPVPGFSDDDVNLKPLHELPKLTQFQYWGKKAFDDMTVFRSRKGERKWEKDHRPLVGRANQGVMGPCHRYEIDATIADVYLVSKFNRNWIIGRPVVYVVVDVFSRMIVGLYVGLEGPSWGGARQALWNAFSDKIEYCNRFGIQINAEDWPCHHLPQEICADRAEMLGNAAENLPSGLGIDLAFPPPYRPDWKAIVESRFRILNRLTQIKWSPGGVAERIKERGERDYRLDATLNMYEFTKIMVTSVLHYNRYSRQPDWLDQDMIAQDIESTPIGIWNWGIEHGFGRPNIKSPELVYLHLLPRGKASVQAGGVYFLGMFYTSTTDLRSMRFAKARAKGRETIDVWYDSNSPESIWIRNEDNSFSRLQWRASESRYSGHRLEEIVDMLEIIKHQSPEKKYQELVGKVKLDEQIQSVLQSATLDKKLNREDISAAQQVSGIRANRAIELAAERAAITDPAPPTKSESIASVKQIADVSETFGQRGGEVINLLSRLRKK